MASRAPQYELHHHFPKLADESGFIFNVHRPRAHVDWHKIRSIDIENIIKERKFYIIEQHLNDILNCVLESEFDVRILDEGVIKMFRLAQLAVEYQQFCRHYLDRSVYVLREEITSLAQELDNTKKSLVGKEEELRKLKKKTRYTCRTPLPFGNDNIATMILKTLSNKNDIIFGNPSTSNTDVIQYNKCNYCDKVFLNQLYLKSHVNRRHSNMLDIPQKDITENLSSEKDNSKLNNEIRALKDKLSEMESLLLKVNNERNASVPPELTPEVNPNHMNQKNKDIKKVIMKDAEVSTNCELNLLDKLEEWKKEEHDKYNKEIELLRTQIVDIINSFKSTEKPVQDDTYLREQLHTTIEKQGEEIHLLKQELTNTRLETEKGEEGRKKEIESQIAFWAKRVEVQATQYEALVQKLNDVALEAKEAKAEVESERSRAAYLEVLLQESLTNKTIDMTKAKAHPTSNGDNKKKKLKRKPNKPSPEVDSKTFKSLHRKAQELLNMKSISSTDISSSSEETSLRQEKVTLKHMHHLKIVGNGKLNKESSHITHRDTTNKIKTNKLSKSTEQKENSEFQEIKPKVKREKSKSHLNIPQKVANGIVLSPGSPVRLVRAKITEGVNNRLVNIGVDPLKNRLPKSYYKKQIMHLQQQHESKSKKTPEYQIIKHSIVAYLDTSATQKNKQNSSMLRATEIQDYVSPNRVSKMFSLTSVISNVKNKALSLVKPNDFNNMKTRRKENNDVVAKKAMALLKTPPSSVPASPVKQRKAGVEESKNSVPIENKIRLSSQKISDKDSNFMVQRKINVNYAEDSSESEHKYYSTVASKSSKSIDNLIKSPARRPSSASAVDYKGTIRKLVAENLENNNILRSQSVTNILDVKANSNVNVALVNHENSSDDVISLEKSPFKTANSDERIPKQTKSVLKNASSTSSLNKKKVLFDMDAIQMKSVSASPSQSTTEKTDNDKFELGLVNLDGEEWDISSIENVPLEEDTRIQVNTRTSPKIAELKHTIESQLARRNETPAMAVTGGVDLIPSAMAMVRNSSIAGSNTSLGSSILDDFDGIPNVNTKAFVKAKKVTEKDDSEIEISEYSIDGILNKKSIDSF